jgi:hypothetical protein
MPSDDSPVGYQRTPVHSRFQKGQSGNPRGRPKKKPDFFEDAAEILGAPVTGQAKGKQVTLPVPQAVFRALCREALKGDNRALRRVINLMLTLEPQARQDIEENAARGQGAKEKFAKLLGLDPDQRDDAPKEPDPKMKELRKRADALAKEEHKRLMREARSR